MNELLGHPLGVPLRVRRKAEWNMTLPKLNKHVELNPNGDYELLGWRKQASLESAKRRKEAGTELPSDNRVIREYDSSKDVKDVDEDDLDLPF